MHLLQAAAGARGCGGGVAECSVSPGNGGCRRPDRGRERDGPGFVTKVNLSRLELEEDGSIVFVGQLPAHLGKEHFEHVDSSGHGFCFDGDVNAFCDARLKFSQQGGFDLIKPRA